MRLRFVPFRTASAAVGVLLVLAGCRGDQSDETRPADAVALGPTSTTLSPDDPPVVIGGAPGSDGFLPVRLNPQGWEDIATRIDTEDAADRFHEIHSEGHDNFWFGVELHEKGPGWTGELGLFATDCIGAGICVRFDPDGGAGDLPPLLAAPTGEIDVEQIEDGYLLVFRNLIFAREDGITYRIDTVAIDTT